jgi:hypothetical protein
MNEPVKIIWKYKNLSQQRVQYNVYIFIGNVPENIKKILEKIKELPLYETLIELEKKDIAILEKQYGEKWYSIFFNHYHVLNTFNIIKNTNAQKKEIIDKFGKEWFDKHCEKEIVIEHKLIYNYESLVKQNIPKSQLIKEKEYGSEDEVFKMDYKTVLKEKFGKISETSSEISRMSSSNKINNQEGGQDDQEEDDLESAEDTEDTEDIDFESESSFGIDIDGEEAEDEDEDEEVIKLEKEEDYSQEGEQPLEDLFDNDEGEMKEIEEIIKDEDVKEDDDITNTSKLIKKALDDENIFDKIKKKIIPFDTSKNNNVYNENLKDVYNKNYITMYFIYKDDTIKIIKEKICASIKNHPSFDEECYLMPSRQYLWSEYIYENNINKVSIGHKWMYRNDLLNMDIEPNSNLRVYEELRGNLKSLRDNMKRYGNKIRYENDDSNILYDYENYYTNNEIYLLDIYNELSLNYKPDLETNKNIYDVYLKLYFPKIKDEFKNIISFLNGDKKIELEKMNQVFETITNDLILETEIMNLINETDKKEEKEYKKVFQENYITQTNIILNLRILEGTIDLRRIFNKFELSEKYPFIQFHRPDGDTLFKLHHDEILKYSLDEQSTDILHKWFENPPYGISFKVKLNTSSGPKFTAIKLTENGRMDYKTSWREEDMANLEDIKKTYDYVKDLIRLLNNLDIKVKFAIPEDQEFNYAFINTLQKFSFPDKYVINHNDLSDFVRYFFPYVSLVIDPRKRMGKQKAVEISKYGTYIRYKRISKYENQAKIEQRIFYIMRNYEYTDQELITEISKQFNITEEKVSEELQRVKDKYPNIKKSRKVLKKMEVLPKTKPPGIGIDIQGRDKENYKMRISGVRNEGQLHRIIRFMNIFMYLYMQVYLVKNKDLQKIKEKLKKLNNIAKRRNKVEERVDYSREEKDIKKMTKLDKKRLGSKSETGENQWSRACQNSGNKRRRPQQFTNVNMDELIKKSYKLNKKTGIYERILKKGKKETVLSTFKVNEYDENGNVTGNEIHYTCNPEDNGEYYYIGFLTKGNNPYGYCMPCCFKKDMRTSNNKIKKNYYNQCMTSKEEIKEKESTTGDILYILQDTNKIQEGRLSYLPKYLDMFFNVMLKKEKKMKQLYLLKSETGYFFKYGMVYGKNSPFLNAISVLYSLSPDEVITKIVNKLNSDKSSIFYTSLNGGEIKNQFLDKEDYIKFVNTKNYDLDLIGDVISRPEVLTKSGINILVFERKYYTISTDLEQEKKKEDFILVCNNFENNENEIKDENRDTIFLLKDGKMYYPIVLVLKKDENEKNIDIIKTFHYNQDTKDNKNNIVEHVIPFYLQNCVPKYVNLIYNNTITVRELNDILEKSNKKEYSPKFQIVDSKNKCIFIVTQDNTIIPTMPSGVIQDVQIVKSVRKYIDTFSNTIDRTNKLITNLGKDLENIKIVGVYYDEKKNNKFNVIALMTNNKDMIPVINIEMTKEELENKNLTYEYKPQYDVIDDILVNQEEGIVDSRVLNVTKDNYINEGYELFRFEFSNFINKKSEEETRNKLMKICTEKIGHDVKMHKLKLLIYKLLDDKLYKLYKDTIEERKKFNENLEQTGGGERFLHIVNNLPDTTKYVINNDRHLCEENKTCSNSLHCRTINKKCLFITTREILVMYINKIANELAQYSIKAYEILRLSNYFVSDIVNIDRYTEFPEQRILKNISDSESVIKDIFDNKYRNTNYHKSILTLRSSIDYEKINQEHSLKEIKNYYVQDIIENNMSIFRAYVNSYYWLRNKYYSIDVRNLGFYSELQSDMAYYFRSLIINWLDNLKNRNEIEEFKKYMIINKKSKNVINDFITKLGTDISFASNSIVELYILNKIHKIPIVIYNEDNKIIYVFDDDFIDYSNKEPNNKYVEKSDLINIRFNYIKSSDKPDMFEVIYFK